MFPWQRAAEVRQAMSQGRAKRYSVTLLKKGRSFLSHAPVPSLHYCHSSLSHSSVRAAEAQAQFSQLAVKLCVKRVDKVATEKRTILTYGGFICVEREVTRGLYWRKNIMFLSLTEEL